MLDLPIVARALAILTSPNSEWRVIAAERTTLGDIFYRYAAILAAIPPVCALIGFSIAGRIAFGAGVFVAIVQYMFAIAGILFLAIIAQYLSPKYLGRDDFIQAAKLVVYAHTASWIGGIFLLIPALSFLIFLFALYGLYLLYAGCSAVMALPPERAAGYTIALILTVVIAYGAIGIIMGLVLDLGMMGVLV